MQWSSSLRIACVWGEDGTKFKFEKMLVSEFASCWPPSRSYEFCRTWDNSFMFLSAVVALLSTYIILISHKIVTLVPILKSQRET